MWITAVIFSGVTDRGANRAPGKLNVKNGPHSTYILVLRIPLVFSRLLFLCDFGVISGFRIEIHIRIH